MRFSSLGSLTLLPLALAVPTKKPELSLGDWSSIQSGFVDRLHSLSDWSWNAAQEIVASSGDESKTVWQQLKNDQQFSKIVKAIEFAEVQDKFDDEKLHFTFFAPNDDALKPPPGFPHHGHGHGHGHDHDHDGDHHHHHHHHDHDGDHHDHHGHHGEPDDLINGLQANPSLANIVTFLESPALAVLDEKKPDDDDKDHERRKRMFKRIVQKVLQYHVIAHPYTAQELANNSTLPTMLKAEDGSFAGLHRRVKIEKQLVPPSVNINFYARVISADNKASNGVFHVINHPLIPPPSIFDTFYQFPDIFSTLTQAIYGLHGKEFLDWHYDRKESKPGKPVFSGEPLATIFAPSNIAFRTLPPGLKFYLFSPFGECALKKILAYHFLPHTLLLSELFVQTKHKHGHEHEEASFHMGDDPSFHREFDVHPALPNSTLHITIDKSKILPVEGAIKTSIRVNGVPAWAVDAVARNGAIHAIGKVLIPPHHHHDEHGVDIAHLDSWENWEEWLPAFADAE